MPTEAESLADLRELIALWGDQDGGIEIPVLDPDWSPEPSLGTQRGLACWVQAEHAVRSAEAAVLLWTNDMAIQAVPSIRLVHECAVTAAWLVTTPGSGHAAVAEAQRQHALLMKGLGLLAGEDNAEEVRKLFEEADRFATDEGKRFEQRCYALSDAPWLYPWYRMLSHYAHGGAGLLNAYAVFDPNDDSHGHGFRLRDPEIREFASFYLGVAVTSLHMALAAWDAMDESRARTASLASFAAVRGFKSDFKIGYSEADAAAIQAMAEGRPADATKQQLRPNRSDGGVE